jgi:outer membrane lipoprotein-sorting protein
MGTFLSILAPIALLALPLIARADDSAAVKELIDKAVNGAGGPAKTAALGDVTLKGKCHVREGDNNLDIAAELSIKDLDKLRIEISATVEGVAQNSTLILAGDKAWERNSNLNKVNETPQGELVIMQSMQLAFLAPGNPAALLARKDLTLTHGGEAKAGDAAAVILRISRKDRPDVTIYFDQKSGLPLKSETRIKQPNDQEQTISVHFSDFKEDSGVKYYGKVKLMRDDKEMAEIEVTEFKVGTKIDPSTFEKP